MKEIYICPQTSCNFSFTPHSQNGDVICPKCKFSADKSAFRRIVAKIRVCVYCGKKWLDQQYSTTNKTGTYKCANCNHVYSITIPCNKNATKWNSPGIIILQDDSDSKWYGMETTFTLKEGSNIIGRKSNAKIDISLPTNDNYMSRTHIEIVANKNFDSTYTLTIQDLSTHNTTYISDTKLPLGQIAVLEPGTKIRIGHTSFAICDISSNTISPKEPHTTPE